MKTFSVSPANYLDWRTQNDVFEGMSIYAYTSRILTGQGEPDALSAALVSADFFTVLGATPERGRFFDSQNEEVGHEHVVVLSESAWRSRFGAEPGIVGRSVLLNGEPFEVVGILPQRLTFPDRTQLWLPLAWTPAERQVRGNHNYEVIARLKDGADVGHAQAEMTTISRRLEHEYPADDKGWGALVIPLQQDLVGDVQPALLVLLGAVAFVLLIACANVANLLLARTIGRSKEIAIRAALGASRMRVLQQLLIESFLLGVCGGIVGAITARFALAIIVDTLGQRLPRASEVAIDGRVLAFTCIVAAFSGILTGLVPAWRLARGDVHDALKQGGRAGSASSDRRVRNTLVVSEVALALMLLVGAGLMVRTLWQLRAVDPGIDPRNVLTMTVALPATKYPQRVEQMRFFDSALRAIGSLPGIESATAVDALPLHGGSTQPVAVEGRPVVTLSEQPEVEVRRIMPGYLRAMRTRLLAGRDLAEADRADRPLVVMVSESMARRFWPGESPLGHHLTLGLLSNQPREVVGVVNDIKLLKLESNEPIAAVYLPIAQLPSSRLSLVVRSAGPPEQLTPAVVNAVHGVDPEQPVVDILTMDDVIGGTLARQRLAMFLLTIFAALALSLAAFGIYSVLSYTVRQRVQELGIRMALGAPPSGVLRMVLVDGLKPILLGLSLGLAAAAALGGLLRTLIFGVAPQDALTFVSVSLVIVGVGVVASLVPAYRATRVDPLTALRSE
jgi:predicted permease